MCLNKNNFCFSFVINSIIISSCIIKFSHQQQQDFSSHQLNQLRRTGQNIVYSQSDLNNKNWIKPGQDLVFATTPSGPSQKSVALKHGHELIFITTTSRPLENPVVLNPGRELIFITTTSRPHENSVVFVNNKPTVPTMVPFIPVATTPTSEFLNCYIKCPTTSEFNPICANNRQVYSNEQKFNCARQCGADIHIVRRGSCEGLFPMARG